MLHFTYFISYTDSHSLCHCPLTLSLYYSHFCCFACRHTNIIFPTCFLSLCVSCSPPAPSFGSWPVSLVLGNTYLLYPQLPIKPHTQQHIAGDRETRSPPVCWCVGGYMITFKYVCLCVAFTLCVCAYKHTWVCVVKQMPLGLTCVEKSWLYLEKSVSTLSHADRTTNDVVESF